MICYPYFYYNKFNIHYTCDGRLVASTFTYGHFYMPEH